MKISQLFMIMMLQQSLSTHHLTLILTHFTLIQVQ